MIADKQETTRNEDICEVGKAFGVSAVKSQESQHGSGLEVSGYRSYNIKHIQITHEHERTNGNQERSIAEGDETGATSGPSRLTHTHLSQQYDAGALNGSPGLAQNSEHGQFATSKPTQSTKQKKINVAKLMFDQDKGYKKPELYQLA